MIQAVHWFLSTLTLLSDIFLIQLAICFLLEKIKIGKLFTKQRKMLSKHVFPLSFAVATTATLGSLFFSEIAHYQPCLLCWYQRILMYPQTLLFLIALIRKETVIRPYVLALSIIGAGIALYHYLLQIWPKNLIAPCSADGISCATAHGFHFGYISIPMMAFTAFMLIIVLMLLYNSSSKKNA